MVLFRRANNNSNFHDFHDDKFNKKLEKFHRIEKYDFFIIVNQLFKKNY